MSTGAQASFIGDLFTLPLDIGIVKSSMNGYKYRLIVSTTQLGLTDPACVYFNDFTLLIPGNLDSVSISNKIVICGILKSHEPMLSTANIILNIFNESQLKE